MNNRSSSSYISSRSFKPFLGGLCSNYSLKVETDVLRWSWATDFLERAHFYHLSNCVDDDVREGFGGVGQRKWEREARIRDGKNDVDGCSAKLTYRR